MTITLTRHLLAEGKRSSSQIAYLYFLPYSVRHCGTVIPYFSTVPLGVRTKTNIVKRALHIVPLYFLQQFITSLNEMVLL